MSTALLAFRPATGTAAVLVRRADVPSLAWAGMLRDGALRPLWDGVAVRADAVVTPSLRLAALADLVPARGVVGRAAAAWVHAGGSPPQKVDVLVRPGGRRTDPHPWRRAAEAPLPAEEVVVLGAGRVTSVQRTGLDVARYLPREQALTVLAPLVPLGFDPRTALVALGGLGGGRGVLRAQAVLEDLDELPDRQR